MTAIDPATCWAPVPTRWRHVRPGDVTVTTDGQLITIIDATLKQAGVAVVYLDGDTDGRIVMDPDEMVHLLVSVPERDILRLTAEQLGARVIDRDTTVDGAA